GNMAQSVILPGIYSDAFPAPADSADIWRKKFADGAVIEYDRAAHKLTVNVPSGSVLVVANDATIDASDTTCTGNLAVQKNLTVDGSSALNGGATAKAGVSGAAIRIEGTAEVTEDVLV
ncbi:MAG: phage baseplate assembly protein V, partial [Glaciimonas sp.]|nr:phage baseplate assembly protein V [Glaciimonas sp.]